MSIKRLGEVFINPWAKSDGAVILKAVVKYKLIFGRNMVFTNHAGQPRAVAIRNVEVK